MNDLTIIKHNGGAYIDSREVAAFVGKRHDNLIRDIVGYVKTLRKIAHLNFEVSEFFLESTYFDRTGRELLCFLCSRKGCDNGKKSLMQSMCLRFTGNTPPKIDLRQTKTARTANRQGISLLGNYFS